jgi:hypothetical protein
LVVENGFATSNFNPSWESSTLYPYRDGVGVGVGAFNVCVTVHNATVGDKVGLDVVGVKDGVCEGREVVGVCEGCDVVGETDGRVVVGAREG